MKITHVCLNGAYCEGYTYQDNLLPQYHRKMGYEVDVIASLQSFDEHGHPCCLEKTEDYTNDCGIHVKRLDYASPARACRMLRKYDGLREALEESAPDILFVHGVQSVENATVVKYMKSHPDAKLFMDNHADYSNSATNWLSKHVLHRVVWRHYVRVVEPYVEVFWGVLPARVDFLVENYGLDPERCDLLVMGADDDEVERAKDPANVSRVRNSLHVADGDFLVVTGGKIDSAKTEVLDLMSAVARLEEQRVRLLVFGPVAADLQAAFGERLSAAGNVSHVPWANSSESYDYFAAADLVAFPGKHSVYWEQAAALGVPMMVKRWAGTDHVDCGGNVRFLETASSKEILGEICELVGHEDKYEYMKDKAQSALGRFLYSDIADKAIRLRSS